MIIGGYGKTHVKTLLVALNLPCVSQKTLKNREREVEQQHREMAEETCLKSLQEEIRVSEGDLSASFDGAWQKRGTERTFYSLTGKQCRICAAAIFKGNFPRVHQCCKNRTGSAKAMEPAMSCEMFEKVETSGGKDPTSLSRSKRSDSNHTKKGIHWCFCGAK